MTKKRRSASPNTAPASARPSATWRAAITSKVAGAAMLPSATRPPTQTTRASSERYRNSSIPAIVPRPRRTHNRGMVEWLPWHAEAFDRAAREAKPVLLSITAAWCRACHEMDRTTYADPDVAALIGERFVPVRVDTDRRPDINERYNLGGWPTTAFLTADGDVVTGGTFVPLDRMIGVLTRVDEAYPNLTGHGRAENSGTRDPAEAVSGETSGGGPHVDGNPDVATIIESIFATFDEEHGGF